MQHAQAMTSKQGWAFSPAGYCRLLLHGSLLAAAIAPFLLAHAGAALFDLPNAMARVGIGLRLSENPDGSLFYTQSFKLIPNMAVDLFGLVAGRWLGGEAAVNLFVALSIAIFYLAIQNLPDRPLRPRIGGGRSPVDLCDLQLRAPVGLHQFFLRLRPDDFRGGESGTGAASQARGPLWSIRPRCS